MNNSKSAQVGDALRRVPGGSTGRPCHAVGNRGARDRVALPAVGVLLALLAGLLSASAQPYTIDWWTVDGGGGTSTGGVYSVSGTIGQPDAGPTMSGGNYTIDGGFWGLIAAVQTPGAPLLSIARTTTNTVAVYWPSPSTGFVLQQNTNSISSVNWSNVVTTPSDDGTTKTVIVDPPTGNRFYRLKK